MKYQIKRDDNVKEFIPFSVTIIIETHEEYVYFHDKVAGLLIKQNNPDANSHKFIGDIYTTGKDKTNKNISGNF